MGNFSQKRGCSEEKVGLEREISSKRWVFEEKTDLEKEFSSKRACFEEKKDCRKKIKKINPENYFWNRQNFGYCGELQMFCVRR